MLYVCKINQYIYIMSETGDKKKRKIMNDVHSFVKAGHKKSKAVTLTAEKWGVTTQRIYQIQKELR